MNGIQQIPYPVNEPIYDYAPGSIEKAKLKQKIQELKSSLADIPMYIAGEEIRTGNKHELRPPHESKHLLGHFHMGSEKHINDAIQAALNAKEQWSKMPWTERASIFLKAAELISGPYRAEINAATMLGQSKNAYQAEIDSACELIDFLRFNVFFMQELYEGQPMANSKGLWNRLDYRALEGFVLAITPFNFTAIAGNLPSAPAMMGNTVVWKPANNQIYAARVIMEIFKKAGLPDGVINLIYVDGAELGNIVFKHPDFSGLHFTGSTGVFRHLWKEIGSNIDQFKSYPRIVGETGGKDFIVAHPDCDKKALKTAITRGAFEYQGQKCSAASRVYLPQSIWSEMRDDIVQEVNALKMGSVEDFTNFINAVIDEKAYQKIVSYIELAKNSNDAEILGGGEYSDKDGYFIRPTIILAKKSDFTTLCEEIFGPVLTIYIYEDNQFEEVLDLVDKTSPYALTGSIFARNRYDINMALNKLRNSAGNFYINDKPTGAVVGQQPFGGGRGSGTNDKAGSKENLLRWTSLRTIKENFNPPTDYSYPFMEEE